MTITPNESPCPQLHELLLAATEGADSATAALAAHVDTCLHCQQVDLVLAPLLAAYRQHELAPLAADLERRLVLRLCGAAAPEPADNGLARVPPDAPESHS